jgi:hypothetical protein
MSRPIPTPFGSSTGRRKRARSLLGALVLLVVFVSATTAMAVTAGMSAAVTTGLLTVAVVGTAVGLWGTAMAVKETHELGSSVDQFSEPVAAGSAPSTR